MTLVASSGRGHLYAHLFENRAANVPRGLYWNLSLPCAPIRWDGADWDCLVQCEWLAWRLADWASLDGATLRTVASPDLVECSVYVSEHHPVRLSSLALTRVPGRPRFVVELSGAFDLVGYDALDAEDIPLHLVAEVDFDGVIVVPDNLVPKPASDADAARAVAPFLGIDSLAAPQWDRFRYVLKPAT